MSAFPPLAIANAVLDEAERQGKPLTVMQLLKLVYIAHGWSLALLNAPLVSEPPQAWQHGPVFPVVYRAFRRFGSSAIAAKATNPLGQLWEAPLDEHQRNLVRSVVTSYGDMHAFTLSGITHKPNTPWSQIWREGTGSAQEIPDHVTAGHYKQLARERRPDA